MITLSSGHSVQAFVDAIGDQVNYLLTVDLVACTPKLDSFDADLQAAFKTFVARWTEKYRVASAHHVEMCAFAQSYLFFSQVAPKAVEVYALTGNGKAVEAGTLEIAPGDCTFIVL